MTNIPQDLIGKILQDFNFTIVDLTVDQEANETEFTIVHDIHPEDEVVIKLFSEDKDEESGEDAMTLGFEGPDSYTASEAKQVLNEVMEVIVKIVEQAIEESTQESGSGSGSADDGASGGGQG